MKIIFLISYIRTIVVNSKMIIVHLIDWQECNIMDYRQDYLT